MTIFKFTYNISVLALRNNSKWTSELHCRFMDCFGGYVRRTEVNCMPGMCIKLLR